MSDDAGWGPPPADQPGQGGGGFGAPPPRYPGPGGPAPGYGQPPPGYGRPGYGQVPPGYGQAPPYGAPGHGQPLYGAPGYGPWSAPPPAPAPGGVPLRPLAVGDMLSGAVALVRRNPAATLGIAAIVQTIYGICSAFVTWDQLKADYRLRETVLLHPNSPQAGHALGQFFSSYVPPALLALGLLFVFQTVLTGVLTGALGRGLLGDKMTIGEAWSLARLGPVLGVSGLVFGTLIALWIPVALIIVVMLAAHVLALAVLAVLGGIGTFIVTLWIAIRLSLAVPVVVLENAGPTAAMKRSWELVQGSWWRIFGITALAGLVVGVIGFVLQIPFLVVEVIVGGGGSLMLGTTTAAAAPSLLAVFIGATGSIIAATCTRPISAGVTVLLYTDMRIRKEGLDLALHQASQRQALTGDEFASLWRPGRPAGWEPAANVSGTPGQGSYPGQGPGGYGPGGYGPGGYGPGGAAPPG